MRQPRLLVSIAFSVLALFQAGCMGYRLGSQLPEDIQSVYVPTVQNQTSEPLLENEVTKAILAEIQQDGSLSIESEENADAILHVVIKRFHLEPLTYASSNRARPNEYRLLLDASVEMVRQDTGEVIVRSGTLTGRDTFPMTGDLTTGKRIGLPGAAEDLARYIVSAITEAWPE